MSRSMIAIMGSVGALLLLTASAASAQMRPGEPPKGALKGPTDCVVINVSKDECKSGKMKVCGASSQSTGSRTRRCV